MNAREEILTRLRETLRRPDLRFPPPETHRLTDEERMTVTQAEGDRWDLARRFGEELTALHGSYELVETVAEARMAAIAQLRAWVEEEQAARRTQHPELPGDWDVLTWEPEHLPVAGLAEALTDMNFQLVTPQDLHDPEERQRVRRVRAGVTGVDAAFASTGSVLLGAGPGRSRVASLTPYRHLVLIPLSKLHPTMEAWLAEQRRYGTLTDFLRESRNVVIISGPSKSADIEGNLTMGVHGPKVVHAILFDDLEAMIRG
ncbi:MAG: hypothetical protein D6790_16285 [Caldilineae bacterium]|nr:MAG: hypothetical protein D6790_16285 [Caldilineae bacterium]